MAIELTERQKACIPRVVFELIPIKDLVSNQDYQRPLSEGHIIRTINDFDVFQINPVKVSRRDGVNYVFDGQHTIEIVANKSGSRDTPVWCMVYDDLLYQEEAHIFAEQQRHVKSLIPYETFKAHLEAGDNKQTMINRLVESYGLVISSGLKPGGICAVAALEYIYDKYGYHMLDKVLRLILATWEGEPSSLSANYLKAVALLFFIYGDALREDVFKEHVGKVSVKAITRNAKERHPGVLGYAESIIISYNNKNKQRLSLQNLYGKKRKYMLEYDEEQVNSVEMNNVV